MAEAFFRLGGNEDLSSVEGGIQWLDQPKEIYLMMKLDTDGTVREQFLCDVAPKILYEYSYENPNGKHHPPLRVGHVLFKNPQYLFCGHTIQVVKSVVLADLLPVLLDMPKPADAKSAPGINSPVAALMPERTV